MIKYENNCWGQIKLIKGNTINVEGRLLALEGDISGFKGNITRFRGTLGIYRSLNLTDFDEIREKLLDNNIHIGLSLWIGSGNITMNSNARRLERIKYKKLIEDCQNNLLSKEEIFDRLKEMVTEAIATLKQTPYIGI